MSATGSHRDPIIQRLVPLIRSHPIPLATLVAISAGAAVRYLVTDQEAANIVWTVGLVICGGRVVWRTLAGMISGRFAADIVAATGVNVMSGTVNQQSPLMVRVAAPASQSQYARIVQLVRKAQASRAPLQRIADRYAIWFTPLTIAVCVGLGLSGVGMLAAATGMIGPLAGALAQEGIDLAVIVNALRASASGVNRTFDARPASHPMSGESAVSSSE